MGRRHEPVIEVNLTSTTVGLVSLHIIEGMEVVGHTIQAMEKHGEHGIILEKHREPAGMICC